MSHQVTLDSILAIEHLLSDEEKQTRDAIRGWVRDRFLPTLTEHHRAGTFPTELLLRSPTLVPLAPALKVTDVQD